MMVSHFPPEAEENRHDARSFRAHRARFSPARRRPLAAALILSSALTACSGDVSTRSSSDLGPRILSGSVGSLADATVTLRIDGGASTISARSDQQASYSLTVDKNLALPIQVQVEGGTDILTGAANDSVLSALSFDEDTSTLSISHLSSLAARMANCQGAATDSTLNDSWTRIRSRSGMMALPDTAVPSSSVRASNMRADLILQESADRTRQALAAIDTLGTEDVLDALACDLADDTRLNGSAAGTDMRLAAVFRAAEAGVILEFMADTPYRAGSPASTAIDALLRQVSGDTSASMANLSVPPELIAVAERHLSLLRMTISDPVWVDLLLSLFSGDPEAAITQTLNANRLTSLWALPEQIALTDSATLARLAGAAAEQTDASLPIVALSADPASVANGETSRLSWAASEADLCVAADGWSGNRAIEGAETTPALNASAAFRLTCLGLAGLAEATTQVAVVNADARPLISLSADNPNLPAGDATTLRWTSSNASACTASGAWSGAVPVVGSRSTGSLQSSSDFTLTCTGPGGSDSATLRISVSAPPSPDPGPAPDPIPEPTVQLSASSTLINAGGTATLTWSASNASQCTASGGWSGDRGTSGSAQVGPINAQTTFSLSCSGAGGTSLDMVAIRVNGSMNLNWVAPTENVDGTPLTDLAGYRVYYGTSSRNYGAPVVLDDPTATSVEITAPSGDYYVAMTALDAEGNESAYSNEVLKTVL